MHYGKRKERPTKTIVLGLLQRGGPLRMFVIPDREKKTLHHAVKSNVLPDSTIITDDWPGYKGLGAFYDHKTVNHSARSYVDGEVYTNGLEGVWAHLKRMIRGTYISVDPHHLPRYLKEHEFRWNTRSIDEGVRFMEALKKAVSKKHISFKQLTKRKTKKPRRGGPKRRTSSA